MTFCFNYSHTLRKIIRGDELLQTFERLLDSFESSDLRDRKLTFFIGHLLKDLKRDDLCTFCHLLDRLNPVFNPGPWCREREGRVGRHLYIFI